VNSRPGYVLAKQLGDFTRGWAELEACAERVLGQPALVEGVSQLQPGSVDPEYDFLKWCSWTYLHYYELARVTARFLERRADTYSITIDLSGHRELVRKLRTFLLHTLDVSSRSDRAVVQECETWFSAVCGRVRPQDLPDWIGASETLARDAVEYVENLVEVVRRIDADADHRDAVIAQWASQLAADHKPTEFDALIYEVARDIGHEHVNAGVVRQRNIDRWRRRLEAEHPGYDFGEVMRPLVEDALLRDVFEAEFPITGLDIIDELEVPRGRGVGRLLARAREIWSRGMTRSELLDALRSEILEPKG
jgi:hypothetical protein